MLGRRQERPAGEHLRDPRHALVRKAAQNRKPERRQAEAHRDGVGRRLLTACWTGAVSEAEVSAHVFRAADSLHQPQQSLSAQHLCSHLRTAA